MLPSITRRRFLKIGGLSTLALGLPLRLARAGRSRIKAAQDNAATARYRYQRDRLFQPIPAERSPNYLPNGTGFDWRIFGATNDYVDLGSGWPWDQPGGDWIDRSGQRYGTQPWFSVPVNAASGSAAVASYAVDVTEAVQFVFAQQRWNAWLWRSVNAPRTIAGTHHLAQPHPVIHVQYADGSSADLLCTYTASVSAGTQLCASAREAQTLPALVEFERPTKSVVSAQLRFTVVEHWSGASPMVHGFLLDPPVNTASVVNGIAAGYGTLDAGVAANPNVFGVHRYLDGTSWSDFSVTPMINTGAEREFDPAIFGNGPSDTTRLPHRGLGKWINAINGFSLVPSGYTGEGFAPLAPGLGAMRVVMPAEPNLQTGSVVGYSGSLASAAKLYLPEPDFGRLRRVFVRYYMRIGTPYVTPFAKRYQVLHDTGPTPPVWTNLSGKIGIAPAHDTNYGGVSGTSGGGYGWQMRLSWFDCDAEENGPNENALTLGLHTYDFQTNNPAGHRYGITDKPRESLFGQRGGLAGVIYPGRWYCIEMEVDLNTVMAAAPGYLADGAVRIWLDGRLGFERTGMVMRSLPLHAAAHDETKIRPVRELGHRDLWFNWFHGGKTQNSIDRTVFITGLVWARDYIGPMRLPDAIFADDFQV
jgi:hypothetical protein